MCASCLLEMFECLELTLFCRHIPVQFQGQLEAYCAGGEITPGRWKGVSCVISGGLEGWSDVGFPDL